MSARNVTLFLMTRKGLAVLDGVIARLGAAAVRRVVGARDRSVAEDYFDQIQELAEANGIPFFERTAAVPAEPDEACLAVGWRWLIAGTDRLVVIHDSLLPRYRGFAPVVSSLINGEPQIGATALLASEGYDEGDIVAQGAVDIAYPMKIADAIELLSPVYVDLATEVVERIVKGEPLVGTPQAHGDATYSLWRDEDDYRIDWTAPASLIRRMVDAVGHPYRGASAVVAGRLVRVLEAADRPDVRVENRTPGKVIFMDQGSPVVVCGEGLLRITALVDDETGEPLLPLARFRTRFL